MQIWNRRAAALVCCALALALAIASTWHSIWRMNSAATTHIIEIITDATTNAGRYVCTYFDNLMRINDGLAAVISRNGTIDLSDDTAAVLESAVDWLPTCEFAVTLADGSYRSTAGSSGTGVPAAQLLGGASNRITSDGDSISVSTAIQRGDEVIGAMTGVYVSDTIASTINLTVMGGTGSFAIFKPDGKYVLRPAAYDYMGWESAYQPDTLAYADGSSADKLSTDVRAGRSGVVQYTDADGSKLCGYYMLLGINDWYIICIAPRSSLSAHSESSMYILIFLMIKLMLIGVALAGALISIDRHCGRALSRRLSEADSLMRKQRLALSTLGGPTFEFDMRALAAHPICEDGLRDKWLLDRLLIPESAGEIVDPRDETAYLKLCDALISAHGKITGDIRLRRAPDAPMRMYRLTLSEPEYSGDNASAMATLIDIDDVAQRMDALRQRAACDETTGLATASELRIQAGRLLERPNHHFGTLAFIRADNQDAVCEANPGVSQHQLMRMSALLITDAFSECDVFARDAGNEFWVFSGDQTGSEIIQKGMNRIMESDMRNGDVRLTFSCGMAHADPEDTMDTLMRRAYSAAQAAHRDGGHRVQHG